jgi:hypothetical protein
VAGLAFLLNALLTMGLATFSILFVEFVEYFEASKTQVTWLAAIYLASMLASCESELNLRSTLMKLCPFVTRNERSASGHASP